MIVERIMTRDVACCGPNDTLDVAAKLMWDRDVGCIPVLERDGRVVGLVTDRDACMAAFTKGALLSAIRVGDVMSKQVRACSPTDHLVAVEERMSAFKIRRMPVIEAGKIVGMISLNDIALAADRGQGKQGFPSAHEVCHTLAAITAPMFVTEEEEPSA